MRPRIMVSHAQNFEDVMLARALRDVEDGFYVDVGAWDPNSRRSRGISMRLAGTA